MLLRDDTIARLPDRQYLLNEEAEHQRIQTAINEAFRRGLIKARARLAASEFLILYGEICLSSSNADLLNDIPFAWLGWFRDWNADPPGRRHCWDRCPREGIAAQEALKEIGVWRIESHGNDESTAEVYLDARKAFLLEDHRLHPGHWLLRLIKTIHPEQVQVHPGPKLYEDANPILADNVGLVLVDGLSIALKGEPGEFPVDAVRKTDTIYLTAGANDATLLISDYVFDNRYDEDQEDEDAQTVRTFIAVGCSQDPRQVVSALLPHSLRCTVQPRLAGAEVRLVFDENGKLASVASA